MVGRFSNNVNEVIQLNVIQRILKIFIFEALVPTKATLAEPLWPKTLKFRLKAKLKPKSVGYHYFLFLFLDFLY